MASGNQMYNGICADLPVAPMNSSSVTSESVPKVASGGSPETRWVQELAANPHVAVHLDGADEVIVLDGVAETLAAVDSELAQRLAQASNRKYPEYRMTPESYRRGVIAIRPRKVVTWTDITRGAGRTSRW